MAGTHLLINDVDFGHCSAGSEVFQDAATARIGDAAGSSDLDARVSYCPGLTVQARDAGLASVEESRGQGNETQVLH